MQATRSFQASLLLDKQQNIDISVNKGQNIKDFANHIVQHYNLPPHVSVSIYSTIMSAMTCPLQEEGAVSCKKELRHLFMDAYQSNTLQYNNKPEEVRSSLLMDRIFLKVTLV